VWVEIVHYLGVEAHAFEALVLCFATLDRPCQLLGKDGPLRSSVRCRVDSLRVIGHLQVGLVIIIALETTLDSLLPTLQDPVDCHLLLLVECLFNVYVERVQHVLLRKFEHDSSRRRNHQTILHRNIVLDRLLPHVHPTGDEAEFLTDWAVHFCVGLVGVDLEVVEALFDGHFGFFRFGGFLLLPYHLKMSFFPRLPYELHRTQVLQTLPLHYPTLLHIPLLIVAHLLRPQLFAGRNIPV
jgi:hypothetical protein